MTNLRRNDFFLFEAYMMAKETVLQQGFAREIDWQENLSFLEFTENDFLREAAWVILSTGMRESVIRGKFLGISEAFRQWRSAREILRNRNQCQKQAMKMFGHLGKISAIIDIAQEVDDVGFDSVRKCIIEEGVEYLGKFHFIGPVTRYHLAKNLGLDVVKPDRHLVRISKVALFSSPHELCQKISYLTGDRLGVVDLVIWRYATIEPRYLNLFQVKGLKKKEGFSTNTLAC